MRRPGAAGNLLGHLLTHLLTIYVLTFTLAFRAASTFLHAILSLASPSMVLQLWPRSYTVLPRVVFGSPLLLIFFPSRVQRFAVLVTVIFLPEHMAHLFPTCVCLPGCSGRAPFWYVFVVS